MSFWIILIVFSLLAIAFAVWPLWRESGKLSPLMATVIVFTVALAAGIYNHVGSPGIPSGRAGDMTANGDLPGMNEAIRSLEVRLEGNPDDVEGWKMLGRTHAAMENYSGAVSAFEKAMELEGGQVAETLIDLALAITNRDQSLLAGRSADLVENALVLNPRNQAALFYAGMAAANRNDLALAADRWEILLGLNPPDNIREYLTTNISIWRGEEPPPQAANISEPTAAEPETPADAVISARVSLSEEAQAGMSGDKSVFIIARDPAAPSPPIAVSRHMLSELPLVVSLTDAQSMVAGRNLSAFSEVEVLARVSMSGGPAAASGDWFGSLIVRPAENNSVVLTIDQRVP